MTRSAIPRRSRRGGPFVFGAYLVAVIASAILATPVVAQQEEIVSLRQTEYDAARFIYDGHVASWKAQEQKWNAARDSIGVARQSGNEDRRQRADRSAWIASLELTRLEGVVKQAEAALNEKRRALQQILEVRQDDLEIQRSRSTSIAQQQQLAAQIRSLSQQIQTLEPPTSSTLQPQLVYLPNVDVDNRDGRDDIAGKIALVERWIRDAGQELARVDSLVQRFKKQQDLQRRTRDVSAGQTLFDTDPPGARSGRPPEPAQGANPDAAGPGTIAEQIAALNAYRDQLLNAQQQLRARVATFRGKLTSMGGDLL